MKPVCLILALFFASASVKAETIRATPDERSMAAISSTSRILPVYEEGELIGYQLHSVEPGCFLHRVGLRAGDRILALNGRRVGRSLGAREFFGLLSNAPELIFEIRTPKGEIREISVEVETPRQASLARRPTSR